MSDNDVLCAVRDSLSGVTVAEPSPVQAIMARGRARRRRRRLVPGVAGVSAAAAAAALAVNALLPAGHVGGQVRAQLAAWTVTKQPGGDVSVYVRQLRDPAGLRRALRADGIPASVTFFGEPNPACRPALAVRDNVFLWISGSYHPGVAFVIHASALPRGVGVQIASSPGYVPVPPRRGPVLNFNVPVSFVDANGPVIVNPNPNVLATVSLGLVYASPQCTGS